MATKLRHDYGNANTTKQCGFASLYSARNEPIVFSQSGCRIYHVRTSQQYDAASTAPKLCVIGNVIRHSTIVL